METEEVLEEAQGVKGGGVGVRGGGIPGEEGGDIVKYRIAGGDGEGVLGFGRGLLAGGVEGQGFMGDEIVEGGAQGIGLGAFFNQAAPVGDGDAFEVLIGGEGELELPANFGVETGQIPGGEIVPGRLTQGSAAHELPAVLLKILPIPMRQHGVEKRTHGGGSLGDFGLEQVDFGGRRVVLGLGLKNDALQNGARGLGMAGVLQGAGDDGVEVGDGGAGQAVAERGVHGVPEVVARAGERGRGRGHEDQGQKPGNSSSRLHKILSRHQMIRRCFMVCAPGRTVNGFPGEKVA